MMLPLCYLFVTSMLGVKAQPEVPMQLRIKQLRIINVRCYGKTIRIEKYPVWV